MEKGSVRISVGFLFMQNQFRVFFSLFFNLSGKYRKLSVLNLFPIIVLLTIVSLVLARVWFQLLKSNKQMYRSNMKNLID